MKKVFLKNQSTTNGQEITQFFGGAASAIQVNGTGTYNVSLYGSLDGTFYSHMITVTSNEIYQLDSLSDAHFKLVVNSNNGLLTVIIS